MNENEAIRRCQNGDGEAFRLLVERYKDMLYGTAYFMTKDGALAEDLVQETFISAWKGIQGFQIGRPVKPWLMRILINKVISFRRQRLIATVPFEERMYRVNAGQEELIEKMERRDEVRRALTTLSEEHRQVVVLRYFADLSVKEIADVLRCPEGTVKSRLHRALETLRQVIRR